MALLAEEIVEEWLNRQGYFTIRGIKLGVDEIDLLAVKRRSDDTVECRHLEVQASIRPVSYISQVPKAAQRQGRAANSVKRTEKELVAGVDEWVHKKFFSDKKLSLKQSLWGSVWSSELVLNVVKSEDEVKLIQKRGVTVIWLKDVVSSFTKSSHVIGSAAGGDFIDLIQMGAFASSGPNGGFRELRQVGCVCEAQQMLCDCEMRQRSEPAAPLLIKEGLGVVKLSSRNS